MTIKQLYPAQRPALDLNFAVQKRLDPRIDFERFSVGTYVGNDGLIKTAVDHEPRFDHDPVTGESLGLLVEESRANLLVRSEDISTTWTSFENTVGVNTATAPDGQTTADILIPNNGSNPSGVTQIVPGGLPDSTVYTFSAFIKFAGLTNVNLQFYNKANTFHGSKTLNAQTGQLSGSEFNGTTSVIAYPNGWYRLILAGVSSGTGATAPNARIVCSSTGDGAAGVYVWGAQLEEGSFPTSYIPTEGSTVTRAADVASITGSNFSSWYNQSKGSLLSQYIPTAGYGSVEFFGSSLNYWQIGASSAAGGVFGFATKSNQGSNTNVFNRGRIEDSTNYGYVIKHAAAIADNDFACYTSSSSGDVNLNTGSTIPATGGYLTPLVDRLNLTNGLTGVIHLSRLTYYPQRLPDATLQALTL